ncbi:MAG TPA: TRAP transporter large permease subunit [Desulfobacteria bacterium]|nr:TRAP transporter large permease subunit [Desulfobacteria bacterium]
MEVGSVTILLFGSLVVGLMTGLPLVYILGGLAVIFTWVFMGPTALIMTSSTAFGVMNNFILVAIPLFVFMGILLQHSGIAEALYEMMYKWVGGIKGGLAMGTIVICTFFAAMSGISGAATVAMGVIALPSMLKHNYHKQIAVGSISAGGALGILIPPSVLMIVYGVFAGESIGSLFAGGLIPGFLLALMFILYIGILSYINPAMGPAVPKEERASWGEKFVSLRGVILPILLILLVLGTIFKGVATPTEAAAIGALGAMVCAILAGKMSWKVLNDSLRQSLNLSCMVIWIIIAGSCLTGIYTALGAVDFIRELVSVLPVSKYVVLIGMQVTLIFLGMMLDPGGIIMICTPVFVPVIKSLGFDPVWFGVLFIVNMEMSYLTPPFGFNLFYMKSIVPESVTMIDIYKSVLPFVGIQATLLVLMILFPGLATWLPGVLIK